MAIPTPAVSLTIKGGVDWFINFQCNDATGAGINLSGYTSKLQLRLAYGDVEPVLALSDGNGMVLNNNGLIECHATAEQISAIPADTYEIGVQITSAGGIKYSVFENQIEVLETAVS